MEIISLSAKAYTAWIQGCVMIEVWGVIDFAKTFLFIFELTTYKS